MSKKVVPVAAGILWKDDKVLACQRDAEGNAGKWEFPGGRVEAGETAEQALRRELSEELDLSVSTCWPYDKVEMDYPDFRLSMDLFVCPLAAGTEPEPRVHSALRWLSQSKLLDVDWLPADLVVARSLGQFWDAAFFAETL